jgi:neutral ceramidase
VIFDSVPRGKNFGDLVETPAAAYRAGEEVRVVFWGAHPNNSIGRDASLLSVERLEGNRWQEVRSDNDPDTFYRWKRDGLANSRIEVRWQVPVAEAGGTYRVCHRGHSKAFLSGEFSPYEGCSQGFLVESVAFH